MKLEAVSEILMKVVNLLENFDLDSERSINLIRSLRDTTLLNLASGEVFLTTHFTIL